jgi:hypothetical protein
MLANNTRKLFINGTRNTTFYNSLIDASFRFYNNSINANESSVDIELSNFGSNGIFTLIASDTAASNINIQNDGIWNNNTIRALNAIIRNYN